MINYANIVLSIRKAKGLTQQELAELTGKSQGYIVSVEKGRIEMPGIDFIAELVLKLDVNPYAFIIDDEKRLFIKNADQISTLKNKLNKYEKLINQLVNEMNGK